MTSDRGLRTPRSQVFGEIEKGTECRVCGRTVEDGRRKTCSEYCSNLVSAVMQLLNWQSVRRRIIERDERACQACGDETPRDVEVDHIRPLADGDHPFDPSNLRTLCSDCHGQKTARENSERHETPTRGELSESLFEFVAAESAGENP
jgi:5-methylcytosine-specific restriction endonuclease McrA